MKKYMAVYSCFGGSEICVFADTKEKARKMALEHFISKVNYLRVSRPFGNVQLYTPAIPATVLPASSTAAVQSNMGFSEQVAVLQQPGPKHISIEADSVIPSAGQVNILITGFIITTDFLPTGIAQIQAQTMPAKLIRMVPEEFRKLIEDRERSLKELFGRVTG